MVRIEALNWFREAIADFERAKRAIRDGDWALAAFMCQQACEKSFKAVYIGVLRVRPPRGHDLVLLYRGLSSILHFSEEIAGRIPEVSQYYTTARYPNAGLEIPSESISEEQARRAFKVAEEVIKVVGELIKGSS
ncbi:MAG: HEPN domain-containing protein [Candidatus Bathyarchaeia archaeon]|nr:HEPN domain-containing protein [Candidatus Bathyarchaeota archaeon]